MPLRPSLPQLPKPQTICDGLEARLGSLTWPVVRDLVDDVVTVSEEEVVAAMQLVIERMKVRVCGVGASSHNVRGLFCHSSAGGALPSRHTMHAPHAHPLLSTGGCGAIGRGGRGGGAEQPATEQAPRAAECRRRAVR